MQKSNAEINQKAEGLDISDFFPADTDWQAVMNSIIMNSLEDDIRAMKLVLVKDRVIVDDEK